MLLFAPKLSQGGVSEALRVRVRAFKQPSGPPLLHQHRGATENWQKQKFPLACHKHSSPTQRYRFRKMLKSWEQKDVDLEMSSQKVKEPQPQIEALRKITWRRIQMTRMMRLPILRPLGGFKSKVVWCKKKATNKKSQKHQRKTVHVLWLRR